MEWNEWNGMEWNRMDDGLAMDCNGMEWNEWNGMNRME